MPFFDFLNHNSENKARISLRTPCIHTPSLQTNYNYSKKERSLTLNSDYTIVEGKQVFITYGSHTNQRLLIEYGFMIDNNTTEHVQMTIGDIETLCTLSGLEWCEKYADVLRKADLKV